MAKITIKELYYGDKYAVMSEVFKTMFLASPNKAGRAGHHRPCVSHRVYYAVIHGSQKAKPPEKGSGGLAFSYVLDTESYKHKGTY